jgi:hypothetical protein
MGCKKQGAKKGVIVIQNSVYRMTGQLGIKVIDNFYLFLEVCKNFKNLPIYRKVASRSTCYYSGNQVFEGATNRDMSLNKGPFILRPLF